MAANTVELTLQGTGGNEAELQLPGMRPVPINLTLAREWIEDNWGRGSELTPDSMIVQDVDTGLLYDFLTGPGIDVNDFVISKPSSRIGGSEDLDQYFKALNAIRPVTEPEVDELEPEESIQQTVDKLLERNINQLGSEALSDWLDQKLSEGDSDDILRRRVARLKLLRQLGAPEGIIQREEQLVALARSSAEPEAPAAGPAPTAGPAPADEVQEQSFDQVDYGKPEPDLSDEDFMELDYDPGDEIRVRSGDKVDSEAYGEFWVVRTGVLGDLWTSSDASDLETGQGRGLRFNFVDAIQKEGRGPWYEVEHQVEGYYTVTGAHASDRSDEFDGPEEESFGYVEQDESWVAFTRDGDYISSPMTKEKALEQRQQLEGDGVPARIVRADDIQRALTRWQGEAVTV